MSVLFRLILGCSLLSSSLVCSPLWANLNPELTSSLNQKILESCRSEKEKPLANGSLETLTTEELEDLAREALGEISHKRLTTFTEVFLELIKGKKEGKLCHLVEDLDPLRNSNLGIVDETLQGFFYDRPLQEGRKQVARSITGEALDKRFLAVVRLVTYTSRLIDLTVTEDSPAFDTGKEKLSVTEKRQCMKASFAGGACASLLRWGLSATRIAKQLSRCDRYLAPWDILSLVNNGHRVTCIEYVTFTVFLLRSMGVNAHRGATLLGFHNPFTQTLTKMSAMASSMFAHNFVRFEASKNLTLGLEPLRKNFPNDLSTDLIAFPLYRFHSQGIFLKYGFYFSMGLGIGNLAMPYLIDLVSNSKLLEDAFAY